MKKAKLICDIVEPSNPGFKFKKQFEDMRKKLRVDDKIQQDFGLKLDNTKLDEKLLLTKEETKFTQLKEEDKLTEKKTKFRRIFKNSYHKIILSFYGMMISLRKAKRDFCIVFRFFGHDDEDIEEFFYEFNSFCEGDHPRYCGDHGFPKMRFDGSKGVKDYRIHPSDVADYENVAVIYRNAEEKNETIVLDTYDNVFK